jgi:hypothetical protein
MLNVEFLELDTMQVEVGATPGNKNSKVRCDSPLSTMVVVAVDADGIPQGLVTEPDLVTKVCINAEFIFVVEDRQEYERSCHNRAHAWFHSQVTCKESIKSRLPI